MSDTEQMAAEKLYKEHGMSLTRAAAAAGMARSTFTKLLRGEVHAKPRKTLTKPVEGPGGPAPARGVGKALAEFRVGDGRQRPQQRPEVRSAPDGVVRASGAR